MQKFIRVTGTAAPFVKDNIDTDVIIPAKRLVAISGMNWRIRVRGLSLSGRPVGQPDLCSTSPAIAARRSCFPARTSAAAPRARSAVWALAGFGFRCLSRELWRHLPSNNAFQNSMLLIRLPKEQVERLAAELMISATPAMTVDLQTQTITAPSGAVTPFEVDAELREALLEGRDEIGMTLMREADIRAFQNRDRSARPWIYRTKPQSTRAV
jgi:3-isopropylmalate/(R)-2-methylmalate dehydratase small subunit